MRRSGLIGLLGAAVSLVLGLAPHAARADDGPFDTLGSLFDKSPTIMLVSTGVVAAADLSFTTVDAIAAFKRSEPGTGYSATELAVGIPQFLGFNMVPFFFDISRWRAAETLVLLLPMQAWTTALTVHGAWSLNPDELEQPGRVGVSYLIGANFAFTSLAFGGLSFGKPVPMAVAATEIGYSGLEIGLSIARGIGDPDHLDGWAGLGAWSGLLLLHGAVSAAIGTKSGSDLSSGDKPTARSLPFVPTVTFERGAPRFGAAGVF